MDVQENNNISRQLVKASLSDQHFLLNFIMGTFLGPDVKTDIPRRSAFQRMAESLPPYTLNDLGASYVSLPEVENLYYYILRNAHPSAILKLYSIYMYLKGKLSPPSSALLEDVQQFTSFFPLNLHEQTRYRVRHKILKGIVLIDSPDTSFIKLDDLERFRNLTGIDDLRINREEFQLFQHGYRTGREESDRGKMSTATTTEVPNGNVDSASKRQDGRKKRCNIDPLPMPTMPQIVPASILGQNPIEETDITRTRDLDGPSMLSVASTFKLEHCNLKGSIVLSGTAKEGRARPPVGLVDIGISQHAYFFRVALPGVQKDPGKSLFPLSLPLPNII